MPYRLVKESRLTTKVRPVFDIQPKGYNGVSIINDCSNIDLYVIPVVQGVLMRFCRWQYAITVDIFKSLLTVEIKKRPKMYIGLSRVNLARPEFHLIIQVVCFYLSLL